MCHHNYRPRGPAHISKPFIRHHHNHHHPYFCPLLSLDSGWPWLVIYLIPTSPPAQPSLLWQKLGKRNKKINWCNLTCLRCVVQLTWLHPAQSPFINCNVQPHNTHITKLHPVVPISSDLRVMMSEYFTRSSDQNFLFVD